MLVNFVYMIEKKYKEIPSMLVVLNTKWKYKDSFMILFFLLLNCSHDYEILK